MEWIEISVQVSKEAADAVYTIFSDFGINEVAIDDPNLIFQRAEEAQKEGSYIDYFELPEEKPVEQEVIVKAYIPSITFNIDQVRHIETEVKKIPGFGLEIGKGKVSFKSLAEEDWATAWKAYYKTIRIGDKLVIKPSWEAYKPEERDIVIELDPGMAFGTGTHPTTIMCLQQLEKLIKGNEKVLDVGTGSGILSIAAAKLGAGSVLAVDIDPVAVKAAQDNIDFNGLTNEVSVKTANLITEDVQEKFDLVVANIIADAIIVLSKAAYKRLNKGGRFISSGIIAPRKNEVEKAIIDAGFKMEVVDITGDWVAFVAIK